jgi:hypothetical protein
MSDNEATCNTDPVFSRSIFLNGAESCHDVHDFPYCIRIMRNLTPHPASYLLSLTYRYFLFYRLVGPSEQPGGEDQHSVETHRGA